MNEELMQVDKLLDDECFFAPFREKFHTLLVENPKRMLQFAPAGD